MQRLWISVVASILLSAGSASRADVYELKDGGRVVGTTAPRTEEGVYTIRTVEGAEITLERELVERIVPQDEAAVEYLRRSRTMPDTAEAHRELAEWCRERKLIEQADHHLARLAELDPNDEEAKRALGYQRVGNRWLTREELMKERGMVLYEGKWRTKQDIAIRQRKERAEDTNVDWFHDIRLWRGWLDNRRPERVAEAEALLRAINDPKAAPALARVMEEEEDRDVFELLLDVLGPLEHPVAVQTLVAYTLDPAMKTDIRDECLDYLINRDRPVQIIPYVQALKSKNNRVVNLAGYALGRIGNPAAVSPLIDALVTKHKYPIDMGPEMNAGFNPRGGGGGLNIGGGGIKIIEKEESNQRVLQALVKLSGKQNVNLEYDEPAWRAWYVDQQMRQRYNSRRDN
ncbi:MAG TPA: hypothetical protein VF175_05445 [Lacipirellula sp.]